jgi:hypothetical protein
MLTMAAGITGSGSARLNSRFCVKIASTTATSADASWAPTQARGPTPNGMKAKRSGGLECRKRMGSNASGRSHRRKCRWRTHGEITTIAPAGMNVVAQQSDARATRLAMSTHDTPQTDFHDMLLPQVVRGFASMFCLLPPTRSALGHLPMDRVPDASGLFNLMRNLGGAVG